MSDEVFCLWGSHELATLLEVQQGTHLVRFASDGQERWAPATEIVNPQPLREADAKSLDESLLPSVEVDACGLPVQYDAGYLRNDEWVLERSGSEVPALPSQHRLAFGCSATLGLGCHSLRKGDRVHALRGEWLPATVQDVSGAEYRVVIEAAGRSIARTVSVSQLVPRVAAAPSALLPGSHVVHRRAGDGLCTEGMLDSCDGETAWLSPPGAQPLSMAVSELHTRIDVPVRVLAPTGGWQAATVLDVRGDGLYHVEMHGGGRRRWVCAAELMLPQLASTAEAEAALLLSAVHSLAGVGPVLPASTEASLVTRWMPAVSLLGPNKAGGDEPSVLVRGSPGQRMLELRMVRKNGRFGLKLDADNQVVSAEAESAAGDAGLRTGDLIVACDGLPLRGELASVVGGREAVVLTVHVEGAQLGSGEGGAAPAEEGDAVRLSRVRLPLLGRAWLSPAVLQAGTQVLALAGEWREALVIGRDETCYSVSHGRGQRRLASAGELAWHDVPPLPYDVCPGQSLLAPGPSGGFVGVSVIAEAAAGGDRWRVEFGDGTEAVLPLSELRERWHSPTRILGLCGSYRRAQVLEAVAGRLRVRFDSGEVGWAIADDTLAPGSATEEQLAAMPHGGFVTVAAAAGGVGKGLVEDSTASGATPDSYERATLVGQGGGDGPTRTVQMEDGRQLTVPREAVRLPLAPTGAEEFKSGDVVHALCGSWHVGFVNCLDEEEAICGRYAATLSSGCEQWTTWLGAREMVRLDQPTAEGVFEHGEPVVAELPGMGWRGALTGRLAGKGDATVELVLADGSILELDKSKVRPRGGASHPLAHARARAADRIQRWSHLTAYLVQRAIRAWLARQRFKHARRGAVRIEAAARGFLSRRLAARLGAECRARRAREAEELAMEERRHGAAAVRIQAATRRGAAMRRYGRARGASIRVQAAARRRAARKATAERRAARAAEEAAADADAAEASEAAAAAAAAAAAEEQWVAATRLQAAARRRAARVRYLSWSRAAVLLQAGARGLLARLEAQRRREQRDTAEATRAELQRQLESSSATRIQAAARRRAARLRYLSCLRAAVLLQAGARGLLARLEAQRRREQRDTAEAARAELQRQLESSSATRIQSVARGRAARASFARQKGSAIVLQSCARRRLAMRLAGQMRVARDAARADAVTAAVTRIQAAARRRLDVTALHSAMRAAVAVQAAARGARARSAYARHRRAAATIQAHIRGYRAREGYRKATRAAVRIQAAVRGRQARKRLVSAIGAAVKIQAYGRRMMCVRQRRRLHRRRHATTRVGASIVCLQAGARGMLSRRAVRARRRHLASVHIQARQRGVAARALMGRRQSAATALQRFARGWAARATRSRAVRAVCMIQAVARGRVARRRLATARQAACTLQACARGMRDRRRLPRVRAATQVQRAERRRQLRRRLRELLTRWQHCGATTIGRHARGMLSRREASRRRAAASSVAASLAADKAARRRSADEEVLRLLRRGNPAAPTVPNGVGVAGSCLGRDGGEAGPDAACRSPVLQIYQKLGNVHLRRRYAPPTVLPPVVPVVAPLSPIDRLRARTAARTGVPFSEALLPASRRALQPLPLQSPAVFPDSLGFDSRAGKLAGQHALLRLSSALAAS